MGQLSTCPLKSMVYSIDICKALKRDQGSTTFIHSQNFPGISASQISEAFIILSFSFYHQILAENKENLKEVFESSLVTFPFQVQN